MAVNYNNPLFEVIRNPDRCIKCRVCERQCANEVHKYDADLDKMIANEQNCVDCQRCVCLCPTNALKIRPNENKFRPNGNWSMQLMDEVYKQAGSGGVLLSAMGNPQDFPVYWDRILLNASQVTRFVSRWKPKPSSAKSRRKGPTTRTERRISRKRRTLSLTCRLCSRQCPLAR